MRERILKAIQQGDRRAQLSVVMIVLGIVFFTVTTKPSQTTGRKPIKVIFPSYVRQVYPNPYHNDSVFNMICITINLPMYWYKSSSSSLEKDEQRVNETLQIKLDDALIVRDPAKLFIARDITVSPNNLAEFPISICEPAAITTGEHKISASWIAQLEVKHTYNWTFETDEVTPIETGKENIHLQVQYDLWREQVMGN